MPESEVHIMRGGLGHGSTMEIKQSDNNSDRAFFELLEPSVRHSLTQNNIQSVSSIAAQLLKETGGDIFDLRDYFDDVPELDVETTVAPIDNGEKVLNHVKTLLTEVMESVVFEEDYEEITDTKNNKLKDETNEREPVNNKKNTITMMLHEDAIDMEQIDYNNNTTTITILEESDTSVDITNDNITIGLHKESDEIEPIQDNTITITIKLDEADEGIPKETSTTVDSENIANNQIKDILLLEEQTNDKNNISINNVSHSKSTFKNDTHLIVTEDGVVTMKVFKEVNDISEQTSNQSSQQSSTVLDNSSSQSSTHQNETHKIITKDGETQNFQKDNGKLFPFIKNLGRKIQMKSSRQAVQQLQKVQQQHLAGYQHLLHFPPLQA